MRFLVYFLAARFCIGQLVHEVAGFIPVGTVARVPRQHTNARTSRPSLLHLGDSSSSSLEPGKSNKDDDSQTNIFIDYINAVRPFTLLQAVGAFVVGCLALVGQKQTLEPVRFVTAAASVYLSYGAGMVANDCVDVDTDVLSSEKSNRAIASGRISTRDGWIYTFTLGFASLLLAQYGGGLYFSVWTLSNLVLMLGYACGLQRLFLVKNLLCGWFAISPLVGAALLGNSGKGPIGKGLDEKLLKLAAVGFPVHVSREILKDAEDVDVDRGKKVTLSLVLGTRAAHRFAFGLVFVVLGVMIFTRSYWDMFASSPPLYSMGVMAGVPMCIKASILPLHQGQWLLKKSIYVLLAGMIGGLLLQ